MLEEMIAKMQQLQESSLLCVLAIGPAAEFENARSIRRALCVQTKTVYFLLSCLAFERRWRRRLFFVCTKISTTAFRRYVFFGKKRKNLMYPAKELAVG